jgi:Glycosyltransferases involved in cell wall biogenesis
MQKVSVIIPVFNAEKYVLNCVDSLLNQSLKEMEFVFVDDCSSDNSIEVIKNYIKGNGREENFIFLKTEKNSGPGVARNVGILESSGRYIAFMDCDDTVEATMYEELYKEAEESFADICNCNAKYIKNNKVVKYLNTDNFNRCKLTKDKKSELLQNFTTYICSYLYKREFIIKNNIFFPRWKIK